MTDQQQLTDFVQRVCPVCGEAGASLFLEKGTLRLVQCRTCAMIYANPVGRDLASGQFYDRLGVPFYLSRDKLESDYAPVRFERELRLFRSFCPKGAVVDVGCSTGAFLLQLITRFPGQYVVSGTDVTGAALDYAERRGIEVIREPFPDCQFSGRRFDAVTFWAVMEHLVRPAEFLCKAAAILKPGGHCFMLVPNAGSLAMRLLGAKYRYLMPDHVNYFTAETLRRFAAREPGLESVRLSQSHFNPIVIVQDWRRRRERVGDEERARLLKRTTAWKQNPLLRPMKWAYSAVERALIGLGLADNLVMVLRKRPTGIRNTR
jgi:2-polyprenyl-3-methyl-5-hydroxy-6-metoxy-1,4-benzoquinol methylase